MFHTNTRFEAEVQENKGIHELLSGAFDWDKG